MHRGLLGFSVLAAGGAALVHGIVGRNNVVASQSALAAAYEPVRDKCMSTDRYNEAVASAVRNTDWTRMPRSDALPFGTRSMIGEFILLKEMQRTGTPPCPDLASLLGEGRVAYAQRKEVPPASVPPGDAPSNGTTRSEAAPSGHHAPGPRKTVVLRPAHVRSQPSKTAEIVGVAQKGEAYNVFATKRGWVQVGGTAPDGWIAAFLLSR
jgi:hypothetical protein